MASLLPDFTYDIFISYRQKDNKYDGWVTEFVDNLKKELEATFKEEISVYFDINPHDGLLETHDVDESLKEKLKCLVFIPIISRTYCDPKSFAWEHEFKVFVEQASKDQFGLKIKLPNGNVVSRVLPVLIHDLDSADTKLCESLLGGMLRGVEFIYKEPGVNKPLTADDNEKKNLNNTKYRIQINKTANAIEEIISGLRAEPIRGVKEKARTNVISDETVLKEKRSELKKPAIIAKNKLLLTFAIVAILIVVGILLYPKIFKRNSLKYLRSKDKVTVAVIPFRTMTNDPAYNYWGDWIQENLINNLSNVIDELKVKQTESTNNLIQSKQFLDNTSITLSVASSISKKLNADIFIYGSINHAGSKTRLIAKLIDSKTEEIFKSFQLEDSDIERNIFDISDSLSSIVKNFLIKAVLEKDISPDYQNLGSPSSPEAYREYIQGMNAFDKADYPAARNYLLQAIDIDSNFMGAIIMLSFTYFNQAYDEHYNQEFYDLAKKWLLRAYQRRDKMTSYEKAKTDFTYAIYFDTPKEEITAIKQLLEIDDEVPLSYYDLGFSYSRLDQYDKAIPEYEKALEIYKKWGAKVRWNNYYIGLGNAYYKTRQYKKEKKLYKIAEKDFPIDPTLFRRQAILALSIGKTNSANEYIEKYKSICKSNSWSEEDITTSLAEIYAEAGIPDKAEQYYRKALSLVESESDNSRYLYNLAWFLIDKDRNINEGLQLINKALESIPDDYSYLHCKGWGLYKQGNSKEALEFLEKSWELKPIYDHTLYLHIEEVKKAIAGKN
jgi:tetratricopeptide (TPR) repeat protein